MLYKPVHVVMSQGEDFQNLPAWVPQQERGQYGVVIIHLLLAQSTPLDDCQRTVFLWRGIRVEYPSNCPHGRVCQTTREEQVTQDPRSPCDGRPADANSSPTVGSQFAGTCGDG